MNLCQYKDALGEPRKGFHSIRLFDFAVLDIVGTFILAYLLSLFIRMVFGYNLNYIISVIFVFCLAIFLHWLFCVNTKLNIMLFGQI